MNTVLKSSVRTLVASTLFAAVLIGPAVASAAPLTRQLQVGMSGGDVSTLQTFLAQDATIYPQGLVTGYFGFLTKAAVSNFQSRNGIETVGRVGPITLAAINAQMAGGIGGADIQAPALGTINISLASTSATINWVTNEPTRGTVYYDTAMLSEYELPHSVTISGKTAMTDTALRTSHSVVVSGLLPNTVYYYDVYVTDAAGNVSMSTQTTFRTTN